MAMYPNVYVPGEFNNHAHNEPHSKDVVLIKSPILYVSNNNNNQTYILAVNM